MLWKHQTGSSDSPNWEWRSVLHEEIQPTVTGQVLDCAHTATPPLSCRTLTQHLQSQKEKNKEVRHLKYMALKICMPSFVLMKSPEV